MRVSFVIETGLSLCERNSEQSLQRHQLGIHIKQSQWQQQQNQIRNDQSVVAMCCWNNPFICKDARWMKWDANHTYHAREHVQLKSTTRRSEITSHLFVCVPHFFDFNFDHLYRLPSRASTLTVNKRKITQIDMSRSKLWLIQISGGHWLYLSTLHFNSHLLLRKKKLYSRCAPYYTRFHFR